MSTPLTLLYTQNLYGQLDHLPRYATFIRRLRTAVDGRVLLLDAGNACSAEAEVCLLTEGRAAPIVLDAMGYEAVNVSAYLPDGARNKLRANYLNTALVDADHPYIAEDGVAYADLPPAAVPHRLHIALETGETTLLSPEPTLNRIYTLTLQTLEVWEVGQVHVSVSDEETTLIAAEVHRCPPNTPPDATISGAVDFVRDEVNHLKRLRGKR
jgi:hypothetical protein